MKKSTWLWLLLISALVASAFFVSRLEACGVVRITAQDGTIISARTMEFGVDLHYGLVSMPRGRDFTSPAPGSQTGGLKWRNKYGYLGVDVMGEDQVVCDGLNETGLSFSALWYDPDTQYQSVLAGENSRALANLLIGSWILGNFSTVDEVRAGLAKVKVFAFVPPKMAQTLPAHIAVQDAKGGSIVVEFEQGQVHIYDNPLGIMTNAPNFPWQVTNLRNYVGMSNAMAKPADFAGINLLPTGHGSGMLGLPGDITPPSRFVRLAVMNHFADPAADAPGALNLAEHIISAVDIANGMVVDRDAQGNITSSETTQWVSFRDLTNKIYYYRTYDSFTLRKIDLKQLDFTAEKTLPLSGDPEAVIDITGRLK